MPKRSFGISPDYVAAAVVSDRMSMTAQPTTEKRPVDFSGKYRPLFILWGDTFLLKRVKPILIESVWVLDERFFLFKQYQNQAKEIFDFCILTFTFCIFNAGYRLPNTASAGVFSENYVHLILLKKFQNLLF